MKKVLCVFALVLACAGIAHADDVVTLDSLVLEALESNPELRADRAKWEASQKRPNNPHAQDELQKSLVVLLYERGLFTLDEAPNVADKLVELARANQQLFAQREEA